MSATNRPDASLADLSSARLVDEDSPAGRTSCSRRSLLLASASALSLSLMSNVGRAQEVPPVRLPGYSPQDLGVIDIDDLRQVLSRRRTNPRATRVSAMFSILALADLCRRAQSGGRNFSRNRVSGLRLVSLPIRRQPEDSPRSQRALCADLFRAEIRLSSRSGAVGRLAER